MLRLTKPNHYARLLSDPLYAFVVLFQFLPNANDATLVTGAADCKVRVHSLANQETTHAFSCHAGRVKRLATAPNVPYMFWSAGEDGTVRYGSSLALMICTVKDQLANFTNSS